MTTTEAQPEMTADEHFAEAIRIERELGTEWRPDRRRAIFARAAIHRAADREIRARERGRPFVVGSW